jgi:hypothetical protein
VPNAPHCCQAPPTSGRPVSPPPPKSLDDSDRCQCQRENVVAYAAAFIAVLWFLGWLFYGG